MHNYKDATNTKHYKFNILEICTHRFHSNDTDITKEPLQTSLRLSRSLL